MRSQDVVFGMPYDIFTFSTLAYHMQMLLWTHYDIGVRLGRLYVRAGSMHIYERHYEDAQAWIKAPQNNNEKAEAALTAARDTVHPNIFISNLDAAAADLQ